LRAVHFSENGPVPRFFGTRWAACAARARSESGELVGEVPGCPFGQTEIDLNQ